MLIIYMLVLVPDMRGRQITLKKNLLQEHDNQWFGSSGEIKFMLIKLSLVLVVKL